MTRGRDGFTLLEVVIAVAILAAGVAALAALMRGSTSLSGGARDVTTATLYASQRLEEALLVPNPGVGETSGAFDAKYRWTLSAEPVAAEADAPVEGTRFRVVVRWDDGARPRSVELASERWRRKAAAGG